MGWLDLNPQRLAYIGRRGAVVPVAPFLLASDALDGRVLTISIDALSGLPAPSPSLTSLTLDGADVLGAASASPPWTYTAPSSTAAQVVAWTVEASNTEGTATASGSESVPADLAVPIVTASDALTGRTLTISIDALSGLPAPAVALTSLTLDGADVLGDQTGGDPWTYTVPDSSAAQVVAWTVEASNTAGTDTASGSESIPANLSDAPIVTASDALAGRDLTISVDTLSGIPAPAVALTSLTLDGADVLGDQTGGDPWTYTVPDSSAAQVVAWTVEASNTAGTDTASGSESVPANLSDAPIVTASDALAGRDLTISVDTLSGIPAPAVALTSLTLDGADVLGDQTGADPWTYTVPDSSAAQVVAWTVEASNTAGTDTASGSESVPANLAAPIVTASDALAGRTLTISVDTLSGTPTPSTSLVTLTLDGADVLLDATGSGPWTYTVPDSSTAQVVAWTVEASNTEGTDTASDSESVPANLAAPIVIASDALAGRDLTISVDTLSGTPTPSVALTSLTLDGADVLGDQTGADPWTYTVPDSSAAQVVAWTVEASNTEGTDTASGSESVPANLTAPIVTASDALAGRDLTISVDTLSGLPAPAVALTSLTLDGADVLGDQTGADPWTYTVPDSSTAQVVAWTVEASNTAGTDTASGSESVPANLTPALLDAHPGALAAYSMRRLSSATVHAVEVRRSSDGATANFTPEEVTDGTLAAFCGSGDGFARKIYDQSGNGNDAVQTVAGKQPRVVTAGSVLTLNSQPAPLYTEANETQMTLPAGVQALAGSVNKTMITVATADPGGGGFYRTVYIGSSGSSRVTFRFEAGGSSVLTFNGFSNTVGFSMSTGTPYIAWSHDRAGAQEVFLNGARVGGNSGGGTASANEARLGGYLNSNFWQGPIAEVILYDSDMDADRAAIEADLSAVYGIAV